MKQLSLAICCRLARGQLAGECIRITLLAVEDPALRVNRKKTPIVLLKKKTMMDDAPSFGVCHI